MIRRLLIWLPLAAFLIVFVIVGAGLLQPADRTVKSALVGKPLPPFALPPLVAGKPGVSSAGQGEPRLVNVFASWCIPCIAEAPQLMRLKQAGVRIEAIAIRDTAPAVQDFLAKYGDPYARIGDDKQSSVQLALGSAGVPETFVIDGQGRIVEQHIGEIRADDVPRLLAALERAK